MGFEEYQSASGAILLDVRTPQEYREGHISGSKNIPLQSIDKVAFVAENENVPMFVCCSGAWSHRAVSMLQHMGYTNVTNMGGIASYSEKAEHQYESCDRRRRGRRGHCCSQNPQTG